LDLADSVGLSISGGYSFENDDDEDPEGFARATVSIDLSILDPRWKSKQQLIVQAELQKHQEPETGALWRSRQTFEKNRIALANLRAERQHLLGKLQTKRQEKANLDEGDLPSAFLLEIEILDLRSQRAEIETNIKMLREVQRKLKP